jgi:4'-phosphopantetheinyl transferase
MPATEMWAWLPSSEQARLPLHPDLRLRSLIGRALVRGLLGERLGMPPEGLHIQYGKLDKPYVADQPWHFNLSHSGAYLLLALALVPVGVDIEQVRPERVRPALLQRVASSPERAWVGTDARRFFQLWCAKEAVLKALGLGLAQLQQVSLDIATEGFDATVQGKLNNGLWLPLASDYIGALAVPAKV